MINNNNLIDRFLRYVQVDSESRNESKMCSLIQNELSQMGLVSERDEAGKAFSSDGGNIHCWIPGTIPGDPILLIAHLDTVSPGKGVHPIIENGIIHSDGTTVLGGDDKSGVAVIMEAVNTIISNKLPHRSTELLFTIGEELGMKGSGALDYGILHSKQAIVFDSQGTVGFIKTSAPGKSKIHFVIHGKAAHAGAFPEKGISAISIAAKAVCDMKLLRVDEETTANIGSFIAEGNTNVVNDLVRMEAEVRSHSSEKLKAQCVHMVSCVEHASELFGGKAEIVVEAGSEPYAISSEHPLVQLVAEACARNEIKYKVFGDGGGSDANNMMQHGITAVALGCGMDRIHTVNETLSIEAFTEACHVLLQLLTVG